MRRGRRFVVLLALALSGCGAEDAGPGDDAARYLDPRADVIASISLDYDGDDWAQVKRLYARAVQVREVREGFGDGFRMPPTLDGAINLGAGFAGLSFTEDIRPLLGGRLLIGARNIPAKALAPEARELLERLDLDRTRFVRGELRYYDHDGRRLPTREVDRALRQQQALRARPETTAVYRVHDEEALARVIAKLGKQGLEPRPLHGFDDVQVLNEGTAVVAGHTIVSVLDGGSREPDRVLRERLRASGAGPPLPSAKDSLAALSLRPAWLGTFLDGEQLARALEETRAGRALRGAQLTLDLERDGAELEGEVEFEGLADDELPLGPPASLALPQGEAIASASSDQARTTVFLARLARELLPDSRFVRRVEALERREGLRFEDEVLRAFSGPSATTLQLSRNGDTRFAARSSLRDADQMRQLLPRIAPALPGILEALEGLGVPGLTALLFVAPDAPLTPAAASLLAAIRVRPLEVAGDAQLYEVRGLDERNRRPIPDGLVYGVAGNGFVVGSTRALAERAASMPVTDTPPAGARMRVDLARLPDGGAIDSFTLAVARALFTTIELEASAEDGDIVVRGSVRAR